MAMEDFIPLPKGFSDTEAADAFSLAFCRSALRYARLQLSFWPPHLPVASPRPSRASPCKLPARLAQPEEQYVRKCFATLIEFNGPYHPLEIARRVPLRLHCF